MQKRSIQILGVRQAALSVVLEMHSCLAKESCMPHILYKLLCVY